MQKNAGKTIFQLHKWIKKVLLKANSCMMVVIRCSLLYRIAITASFCEITDCKPMQQKAKSISFKICATRRLQLDTVVVSVSQKGHSRSSVSSLPGVENLTLT